MILFPVTFLKIGYIPGYSITWYISFTSLDVSGSFIKVVMKQNWETWAKQSGNFLAVVIKKHLQH